MSEQIKQLAAHPSAELALRQADNTHPERGAPFSARMQSDIRRRYFLAVKLVSWHPRLQEDMMHTLVATP